MPTEAPAAAQHRTCPACGTSLRPWRSATASDPELAGRSSYPLERCTRCATAVTIVGAPPPEGLYEGGAYAPARGLADSVLEPLRRLIERDKLRFVRDLRPGAQVVEIGAGDGSFVAAMRDAGLDARGYDSSAGAVAAARGRDLPVTRASAEQVEPGSDLDGVVVWHTLEHLADPAGALLEIRDALRPGGRLVVACPNLASLQARIGGDRWFHQDVPRHRTHFTAAGLVALVERSGFSVERVSHLLIEQNPLGMWLSFLNRLTVVRDLPFRLVKRNLSERPPQRDLLVLAVLGAPLAVLAALLELGAALSGRGGSVVIVASRAA